MSKDIPNTTLFGPPGSGKTTTLSKWAKQAAVKHGGENVMICSLTKTAASEIRSRSTDVPDQNVGTLHAHAYRGLSESGYRVLTPKDATKFNSDVPSLFELPIVRADTDDVIPSQGSSMASQVDLMRAKMVPVKHWPVRAQQFWELYSGFKERENILDFTDMIEFALYRVDCPVDYLIMDEAQDCSKLEFELLTKWAQQGRGVIIAGDDDQAAYEWRGASVREFLTFSENQKVLPRSYRLPLKIKEYADRWIHRIANRKEKIYEPRDEIGHLAELDFNSPEDVVEHALRQQGTSMILTTCGYMTVPFVECLKENADSFCNPYRVTGDYASTWNPMNFGRRGAVTAADSLRAFLTLPQTYHSAYSWCRKYQQTSWNMAPKPRSNDRRATQTSCQWTR